jgi:putative transposase
LREEERECGAFTATWTYIATNPERAGLVADWRTYLYLGTLIPGFPDIDPRDPDYWKTFWKILPAAQERANR